MIEYFLENMWQVWAIVAVLCLILELSSGDFFIICFSIGAVFGVIGAAIGLNIYWHPTNRAMLMHCWAVRVG